MDSVFFAKQSYLMFHRKIIIDICQIYQMQANNTSR